MGLKEIQKYWKINHTVLYLFFQYLDKATSERLQTDGSGSTPRDGFLTIRSSGNVDDLARTRVSAAAPQDDTSELASLSHIMDNWMFDHDMLTDTDMYTNVEDEMQGFEMLQRCL